MNKQAIAALTLGLGLALALTSTNCVTCPPGQQSCGTSNGSGNAGANGDGEEAKCPLLTAMRSCMDAFCKSASNPYCTCYKRGYDLTTNGCKCIDFDAQKFCDDNEGVDASAYDCAAASSGVASYCVNVQ